MVDPAVLGALTVRLMDQIEEQYGPEAELHRAMLIVEIEHNEADTDPDDAIFTVQWASTEESPVAKLGLVTMAAEGLKQ